MLLLADPCPVLCTAFCEIVWHFLLRNKDATPKTGVALWISLLGRGHSLDDGTSTFLNGRLLVWCEFSRWLTEGNVRFRELVPLGFGEP
jgi:hypothetical protein